MDELDIVALIADWEGIPADTEGTIVLVHTGSDAFDVEFTDSNGDTLTITTVAARQVRPVWSPRAILPVGEWVALCDDFSEHGLRAGDAGTITHVQSNSTYVVTFSTLRGQAIAVAEVTPDKVRRIGTREIAHVRVLG